MKNLRALKLRRRVRREANKLITQRRYRAVRPKVKGGKKGSGPFWPVWTLRVGPAAPSEKVLARKKAEKVRLDKLAHG